MNNPSFRSRNSSGLGHTKRLHKHACKRCSSWTTAASTKWHMKRHNFIYLFIYFLWTIGTWGSWVWEERPKHVSVHPKWGRWGLSRSNSNIFRNFNWLWHWFKISVSLEDADYSPVFIAKQTIWTLGISPFHPAFRWCSPHQGPTEVANLSWNTVEPINSNEAGSSLKWFPKDPCMEYLPTLGLF